MRNPENISARRANLLGDRPGAFAEAKHLHMSATKMRRVINMVRGQDAITALAILRYAPQAAAVTARKTLQSAIANAENQEGLEVEDLYVSTIFADEGATLRRIRARAKGSASRILKRGAHLTIVVEPRPDALEQPALPDIARRRVANPASARPTSTKPQPAKKTADEAKKPAPRAKATTDESTKEA